MDAACVHESVKRSASVARHGGSIAVADEHHRPVVEERVGSGILREDSITAVPVRIQSVSQSVGQSSHGHRFRDSSRGCIHRDRLFCRYNSNLRRQSDLQPTRCFSRGEKGALTTPLTLQQRQRQQRQRQQQHFTTPSQHSLTNCPVYQSQTRTLTTQAPCPRGSGSCGQRRHALQCPNTTHRPAHGR